MKKTSKNYDYATKINYLFRDARNADLWKYLKNITCSDLDPDPCGSVFFWPPGSGSALSWISWIRIRIGNTGELKFPPKNEETD